MKNHLMVFSLCENWVNYIRTKIIIKKRFKKIKNKQINYNEEKL